ncbi:MAG: twin-arginine translocase subunit TatC [Gammaproteobacteria bacterium]
MSTSSKEEALHFLIEVRSRLIRSLIVTLSIFIALLYFANHLYTWLALPLLKFLPSGHLIATQIVSPFFVPFKLAFMASLLLSIPFILYQIWGFIAPALYEYERRWIWPFILLSTSLFYSGMAFAYFVIFPMLFQFLAHVAPQGVELSPDIGEYLDFTIKLLLIFGVLFEIPIVMSLLVRLNVVSRSTFIKKRAYAIVGAFVVGMLLAPPDVLSQTVLAVPVWVLYEVGILLARFVRVR